MLVLDMIEILPPMEKYRYDTYRILSVKCYIDNFVCLRICVRNVSSIITMYCISCPSYRIWVQVSWVTV
jgi:hypothetical protein